MCTYSTLQRKLSKIPGSLGLKIADLIVEFCFWVTEYLFVKPNLPCEFAELESIPIIISFQVSMATPESKDDLELSYHCTSIGGGEAGGQAGGGAGDIPT